MLPQKFGVQVLAWIFSVILLLSEVLGNRPFPIALGRPVNAQILVCYPYAHFFPSNDILPASVVHILRKYCRRETMTIL